ncbi:hypothetical protein HID58_006554 [Brassica napus]|uniref:BnaAnng03270D protein n=3 Tax=Brassica TaxID=3705 RepID=A0A078GNP2_BRANA|nr:hypothetical protein HID58_006554 [Brassica napus]CAF2141766.1 unnamed protein product [Brassica napus]CAG7894408.1 unnamed protein product [Brassica rapa]CDY28150.1 BnaAnng03270D [Brassica napus]VDC90214.1 unnamed protein product [Brassica rapa]
MKTNRFTVEETRLRERGVSFGNPTYGTSILLSLTSSVTLCYYINNTADYSPEYHEVTPDADILSECSLNGMRRNDPTNAKSEALMVQFENMLAKYQDQHLYDYQIAKTIMTNPTRADEDDVLNSVFVDTVGYGTVCTSSIMVKDFIVKLNMWRLSFCERYREENGNWSEHHENFCIANDYIPTWQRWKMLEEEKKMKEAAEASTKAAEYVASAST